VRGASARASLFSTDQSQSFLLVICGLMTRSKMMTLETNSPDGSGRLRSGRRQFAVLD
jgi:hypothetical protein